jgi:hypothetical protein
MIGAAHALVHDLVFLRVAENRRVDRITPSD